MQTPEGSATAQISGPQQPIQSCFAPRTSPVGLVGGPKQTWLVCYLARRQSIGLASDSFEVDSRADLVCPTGVSLRGLA